MGTGESLITQTYNRFKQFVPEENIIVVTNHEYLDMVRTHLPSITEQQILAEPQARNTAPCIAYATGYIKSRNEDAICVVAPSDHLITNEAEFQNIINDCYQFATQYNSLITIGIKPTRPDTGYGYIQYNPKTSSNGIHEVKTFTEKPTEEIAKSFIESGEFLWNAGIFVWSLNAIANRFEHLLPEINQLFSELDFNSPNISNELEITYGQCPSISIDYGIMEKDKNVFVLPSNFGWSDLGTWKSLWDVSKKDSSNNSLIGNNIRAYQSSESLVFSNNEKLLVISGLENVVVVDSDDVLLIMNKDKEQELRNIVNEIKDKFKGKYN
jgi:mannose-1-phosphate guanylyltransferase